MGRAYVIDHALCCFQQEMEEKRYRAYITDALRILTENSTHYLIPGVGNVDYGMYLKDRWIEPSKAHADNRTGDEIAADIINRAGLRVAGEGE